MLIHFCELIVWMISMISCHFFFGKFLIYLIICFIELVSHNSGYVFRGYVSLKTKRDKNWLMNILIDYYSLYIY